MTQDEQLRIGHLVRMTVYNNLMDVREPITDEEATEIAQHVEAAFLERTTPLIR